MGGDPAICERIASVKLLFVTTCVVPLGDLVVVCLAFS